MASADANTVRRFPCAQGGTAKRAYAIMARRESSVHCFTDVTSPLIICAGGSLGKSARAQRKAGSQAAAANLEQLGGQVALGLHGLAEVVQPWHGTPSQPLEGP